MTTPAKKPKTPSAARKQTKTAPDSAPLICPVIKYTRILNDMNLYAKAHGGRVSKEAAHAIAAAVEYLGADLIERAADCSSKDEKSCGRISRRHLIAAINADDELVRIFVIPPEALKSLKPKRVLHVIGQSKLKRHRRKKAEEPVKPQKAQKTPKTKAT